MKNINKDKIYGFLVALLVAPFVGLVIAAIAIASVFIVLGLYSAIYYLIAVELPRFTLDGIALWSARIGFILGFVGILFYAIEAESEK